MSARRKPTAADHALAREILALDPKARKVVMSVIDLFVTKSTKKGGK